MASTSTSGVLTQAIWPATGTNRLVRQVLLVAIGVLFMAIAAKIKVPMWPVPITMQTFAVLTIGAAYGAGLGFVTLLAYLAVGMAGLAVFTGEGTGLAYMAGPTGGYLVGFVLAATLVGWLAERGWSRSVPGMVGALFLGNVVIYAAGMPWMFHLFLADKGFEWVMQWGMTNFLLGDALKLALAALLVPVAWRFAPKG